MARILTVDDRDENLSLLEDLLTGHGHTVESARNGAEALEAARRLPPDLVISDILMPVMDGFTLCREWRQDGLLKGRPFMFLTATYTDPKDEEFALSLGADRFLLKPVEPDVIAGAVTDLLRDYEGGASAAEAPSTIPTPVFLRQYNEVLIRKLEDKLADADKANRELVLYRQHLERLVDSRTTALKKTNVELRKLNELKENLTHLVVHDMRSPLAAILGALELTTVQANLPASVEDDLKRALHCTRRLTEMTGTVLDVSRMEAGEMPLNLAEHDLFDLACSAADSVSILARMKNVRISISGSPVVNRCDAALIRRVIVNLLDNAIKFSPRSEPVNLDVASGRDSVLVSVTDNGPGIPPEHQCRVFDKFFQVDAPTRGLLPSPGLGLALCKLAVEAHHGRIGIESEPGHGSRFWFALPL